MVETRASCTCVGWLHDMIQTTPFCELRVTSERRSDSVLSICESAKGIIVNTRIDQLDVSHSRSLFVSIRHPRSLASRSGRRLPIAINIRCGVEPGSHCSGCSVGPGPHYAMAASSDSSAPPMTAAQCAEKLAPYMKTYISTSSNHTTFIRTFLAVVGGMAQSSQAPPSLQIKALTENDNTMNTQ